MDRAEFPCMEGNVPLLESRKEMHYSKSSGMGKGALRPAVVDTQSAGERWRFRFNRGIDGTWDNKVTQ